MNHTPTPWIISPNKKWEIAFPVKCENVFQLPYEIIAKTNSNFAGYIDNNGDRVMVERSLTDEGAYANAEFIVRAVNNHDKLVEALNSALGDLELEFGDDNDNVIKCKAALKSATL